MLFQVLLQFCVKIGAKNTFESVCNLLSYHFELVKYKKEFLEGYTLILNAHKKILFALIYIADSKNYIANFV